MNSVHPHSRGEHGVGRIGKLMSRGSSPLARGTFATSAPARRRRFIPTRAGNIPPGHQENLGRAVHPHSRGEHQALPHRPPPARRFIPTRAGNIRGRGHSGLDTAVHPHSRGEHLQLDLGGVSRAWFIPTRAGNIPTYGIKVFAPPVHPHSRGEHCARTAVGGRATGSSPLARGTSGGEAVPACISRFIPTRAGNIARRARSRRGRPVHPHSRGEHGAETKDVEELLGSSPLARGTFPHDPVLSPKIPVHPHSRGEHGWPPQ